MLSSKMADGTPMRVVKGHRMKLLSGASMVRSGHQGTEFLLKNQILRSHLPTGCITKALLGDALKMEHGKGAEAVFAACVKG